MLFKSTHLNNKLKWSGVFLVGLADPIILLALNASAFETNSGLLFMVTYAGFHVFCPGLWFNLDSAYLIRNAIPGGLGSPENFISFIFWSLINGFLYLSVLHLLERFQARKCKERGGDSD